MKTDFDKYISDQIQNIEDNLQVGNWDAFQVCYAKNRRTKTMRVIIPIAAAASIIMAFVFLGRESNSNDVNYSNKEIALIADNATDTAIIKTEIPECKTNLIALDRPHKVTVPDSIIIAETNNQEDSVTTIEIESNSSVPKSSTDTSSRLRDSYTHFETEIIDAELLKAYKPKFSIGLSGGPGMTSRAGTMIQINAPGNGMLSGKREEVNYRHLPPISFEMSVGINLSKRFTIITGLDYSLYLSHKEITSSKGVRNEMQQIHYLGLPIRCDYTIYSNKSFEWYVGGGFEVEKCVSASSGTTSFKEKNFLWSAVVTTGIQYNICRTISLYCEPYCSYLLSETSLFSYRSDNPIGVSANLGIRFNLR
jgi:hypothetical protein